MVVTASTRYIVRDRNILDNEPIVKGTEIPVRDIVALWQDGVRPEDIPETLYHLISTAQVFDALGFYLDNQAEIDQYMQHYQNVNALSRAAILLSHSPFWDDVERCIESDRQILDAEMSQDDAIQP